MTLLDVGPTGADPTVMTPQRPQFDDSAFAPLPGDEERVAPARAVASPAPTAPRAASVAATPATTPAVGAVRPPVSASGPDSIIVSQETLLTLPAILRNTIAAQAKRIPKNPLPTRYTADTGYSLFPGTGKDILDQLPVR